MSLFDLNKYELIHLQFLLMVYFYTFRHLKRRLITLKNKKARHLSLVKSTDILSFSVKQ